MKNLKKFLSFVVALSISATLAAPAFAETLTISVNGTDILGSTVNLDASEETVETVIQPNVLLYRDYEDYTSGSSIYNSGTKYGTWNVSTGGGVSDTSKAVAGADGTGVEVNKSTKDSIVGSWGKDLNQLADTGIFYVAFDIEKKSDEVLESQDGNTTTIHETMFYVTGSNNYSSYVRFSNSHSSVTSGLSNWNTLAAVYLPSGLIRVETIFDLDTDKVYIYENGVKVHEGGYGSDIKKLNVQISNGIAYFDNLTIVHYPTDCKMSYSLTGKAASIAKGTLTVDVDSDTKMEVAAEDATTTYTANYPVILTEELTAENFTVTNAAGETVAVESVTKNKAFGSYNLKLAGGVAEGEYTVTLTTNATDNLGATLNNGTATVTAIPPKVIYFRDYENYTSGSELYQGSYYPSGVDMGNNGSANSNSTATTGDGIAVDIGKHTGPPPLTVTEPITSGEVYIGVDVAVDKDISPAESYFMVKSSDNNTGRYIRFRPEGAGNGAWEDIANFANLDGNYHRLEVVINLDTKKVSRYLDGAKQGNDIGYGRNNFKSISFWLQETISKWDNLTIVHYPTGAENTFSIAGKGASYENNTITVDFDSNAKSDGLTANYPSIVTKTMTPSDFNVTNSAGEAVAVSSVVKNTAFGSYDLVLADTLIEGETYTVSVASDLETALGAAIVATEATVKAPAPKVIYFDDYEDYETGKAPFRGEKSEGFQVLCSSAFTGNSSKITGNDGIAVDLPTGTAEVNGPEAITSGKVYIGFDVAVDLTDAQESYIVVKDANNSARYIRFRPTGAGNGNWREIANFADLDGNYHRLEVVINLDTKKVSKYLDGVQQDTDVTYDLGNFQKITLSFKDTIDKWDNFTVIHIPSEALPQTFSLQEGSVDLDTKTFKVQLKSDIVNGAYPIETADLTAEDFTVSNSKGNLTITNVKKADAVGEYKITVAEEITGGDTYVIKTSAERTDALGLTLDNNATAEVYVEAKVLNIISVNMTVDENGTPLTAENVPAVDGTVYAEVTYTNTTGEDVTFMVLGATYSANRMTNAIAQPVVASKTATTETKVYLPITVTNATDFTAKAFAVNNLTSITPIN